jgi:hypothetical protein
MKNSFTPLLRQLREIANQFDETNNAKKKDLLKLISKIKIPVHKSISDYQHLLLFLATQPFEEKFDSLVKSEMERLVISIRKMSKKDKDKFDNSGLPFTKTQASFTHDLLKILDSKKELNLSYQSSDEENIELNSILSFTLPDIEKDHTSAGMTQEELWETLGVKEKDRLPFLLGELDKLNETPFIKDYLVDKFNLFVNIEPTDKKYSKIFNHIGVNKKYFHSDILKRFDHVQLLNTPLPNPKKLSELEIERMIEVMQTSLYLLERETDPCTFIDKNSLRYYELERGISIALFGMIPERQMSMESYVGYTLFKNGYPAAYGGGWIYGTRSLFGINIFEQFRGGESGYILIQLLRTYKQAFNLTYFEVEPYQYGLDNPEGIESGAFWFYYRYGFRPLDKTLNKLANSEFEKINLRPAQSRARSTQAPKTYRSSKTTLTKFTDSNIGLQLGESIPPKVTDLRAKITKMIALKFDNNRTKAIEYCIKELRSKIKIKKDLNKFEKIVLRDLALAAEALCINNTNKLNLIGKMIELKPVDLYSYNLLLSDWLK